MSYLFRNLRRLQWNIILSRNLTASLQYRLNNALPTTVKSARPIQLTQYVNMSTNKEIKVPALGFEEIKNIKGPNQYLIDVRERDEIRENGELPGAINIPLSEIQQALTQYSPEVFKKKYNVDKPDLESSYIVFSCRSGKRSDMAAQLAITLGYKNVAHYAGGYLDWESKTKGDKSGAAASN